MTGIGMASAAPNVVMICINRTDPAAGVFYHRYSREPVSFYSVFGLVDAIDKFCNEIGYPACGMSLRSFGLRSAAQRKNYREVERVMSFEDLKEKKGEEGTFMVHVQFRQNATWQGQVTWMEKKQTQQFRSALELMKLIDGALNEQGSAGK